MFACYECESYFANKSLYLSHEKSIHRRKLCLNCKLFYSSENHNQICQPRDFLKFVFSPEEKIQIGTNNSDNVDEIKLVKSAFRNFVSQFELFNQTEIKDIPNFFAYYSTRLKKFIKKQLEKHISMKIQICLQILFNKYDNDLIVEQLGYFCSATKYIANIKLWTNTLSEIVDQLENQLLEYPINGSNWVVERIVRMDINIGKYLATYGSCETNELPEILKNKKAIINVKNSDEKCFLYAVCVKLFPVTERYKRQSPNSYIKHFKKFNLKNIKFPMDLRHIDKFELQNSHLNFKINLYGFNNRQNRRGNIFPIKISKIKAKTIVNLLLFNEHYYFIQNFNRLNGRQGGKFHRFCYSCLQSFEKQVKLDKHVELCYQNKPVKTKMPEYPMMKFNKFSNQLGMFLKLT